MTVDGQKQLARGHHRLACPECAAVKHRRNDTALSVDVGATGGVYFCHRCGMRGRWRAENQHSHGTAPPRVRPQPPHLELAADYATFWRGLGPVADTAAQYLQARQCVLPPADGDLRSTEALRHPSGYVGPALVALVTDALTGAPMTLHRTWIKADGTKADVDPPRHLLRGHRKQGGVVRLWPDEALTTGLAIAEGIESALTLAEKYTPVWSLIDAGNLAEFPVLEGVESLLIGADNDPAGLRAMEQCADRWYRAGRRVRILISPVPGQDLNDFAMAA